MAKVIKLAVGIPAYGGKISSEHAVMWLEVGNTLGASSERFQLVMFSTADMQPVDRARNFLLANAMIQGADWLLMIDADTWVKSNEDGIDAGFLLLRMISDADRAEATIVSAPVVLRAMASPDDHDLPLAVYRMRGTVSGVEPLSRRELEAKTYVKVHTYAVGAACLAINLHKIGESTFKFTDELSEDLEFCRQIRELGGKILVDDRVRTAHLSRAFPLFSR